MFTHRHPYLASAVTGACLSGLLCAVLLQFNQGAVAYFSPGAFLTSWLFKVLPRSLAETLFGAPDRGVYVGMAFLLGFVFWFLVLSALSVSLILVSRRRARSS
jgi:Na+-transporting NADH:ubiquinone oxidoreductase subunit NqrB